MRQVKTLGLLGTGVIGGGWAARALHFGIDVLAADVKPEMETWIRGAVANAESALSRLTLGLEEPTGTAEGSGWEGTGVVLGPGMPGAFFDVLRGVQLRAEGGTLPVRQLFGALPVALAVGV